MSIKGPVKFQKGEIQKELKDFIAKNGMFSPFSGKVLTTKDGVKISHREKKETSKR